MVSEEGFEPSRSKAEDFKSSMSTTSIIPTCLATVLGFEPRTSTLEELSSIQLSYTAVVSLR